MTWTNNALPPGLFPRFRPPAEAESVIVGLASGCSHNGCTFCGMYSGILQGLRTPEEFREHVALARGAYAENASRVFIGDGDAMAAPSKALLDAIAIVREFFPAARRFGVYARAEGILEKSGQELRQLAEAGLRTAYLGLESGDEEILRRSRKGCTAAEMVEAVRKAQAAGIRMSVMALVGLGGQAGTGEHARATAAALSAMNPRFASLLTYLPVEGTPLADEIASGRFALLDDRGCLEEIRAILERLDCDGTIFRADHASNPLPLAGNLARDKARLLAELGAALAGTARLRPGWLRGL
jgi:radical SAM superfamily enzyme YgiQ (UPF0313 family)